MLVVRKRLSYLYDLVGNVTQRQNVNNGMTENFYYGSQNDSLYRLEHSSLNNGSTTVTNLQLTYDGSGNILTKDEAADSATLMGQTISWTEYNYPKRIDAAGSSATFSYGPNRQRWRMVFDTGSNPETTFYIGGLLEEVVKATGTTYRHSIVAGGRVVAMYYRTGSQQLTRYVLDDHQGSAETFVDDGTGVITRASFTAYGRRRDATSWAGDPANRAALDDITRQGYTFQTVLGSMGLNHMNGRVQDAITGRFLSADPYVTDAGYTQNYNRYSYVYNNPLTFRDPTGFGSGPNDGSNENWGPDVTVTHTFGPWSPDEGAGKPDDDSSDPCKTPWGGRLTDDVCQIVTAQVGMGEAIADSKRAQEDAKHKHEAPQKNQETECTEAMAQLAANAQAISNFGSKVEWFGIGSEVVGGAGLVFFPEAAPAEEVLIEGGGPIIDFGGYISTVGEGLSGYAHGGLFGAGKNVVLSLGLDKLATRFSDWKFPLVSESRRAAFSSLLADTAALLRSESECHSP